MFCFNINAKIEQMAEDKPQQGEHQGGGNPAPAESGKGGKGGAGEVTPPPGWGKNDPITFEFLVESWGLFKQVKGAQEVIKKINLKVQIVAAKITFGLIYLVVIVKPKFLTDTVGALLEMANSGLIPGRTLITAALKLPVIHGLLKMLRG